MIPEGRLRIDQRPLYVQASEALRNLLKRGGYAAGDRLPSEVELSQQLGISRPTLREALRLLEEEGAILRRHGVGTFVAAAPPVIEGGLEVLESIDRMAERQGLETGPRELSIVERMAGPDEWQQLGLAGEAPVVEVSRVIVAGTQRVAYLQDVVPCEYLRPPELGSDFTGSVLDLFLHRGWPALSHSRTALAAQAADVQLAHQLQVKRNTPLLTLTAQLYADCGRVVDYSTSHFITSYFRFHVIRRIG